MLTGVSPKNNVDNTEVVSPNRAARRKQMRDSATLTGKITAISKSAIQATTSIMPAPIKDRCGQWCDNNSNLVGFLSLTAIVSMIFIARKLHWHTYLIALQWPD